MRFRRADGFGPRWNFSILSWITTQGRSNFFRGRARFKLACIEGISLRLDNGILVKEMANKGIHPSSGSGETEWEVTCPPPGNVIVEPFTFGPGGSLAEVS